MKRAYLLSLGILALAAYPAAAQILYQQNFDSAGLSSTANGPGGYVSVNDISSTGWQVQGGCGGGSVILTAGVNGLGAGGSQALFGTWDYSAGTVYTWSQMTYYGLGNPGAGATLSSIQISLDLFMNGSEGSSTPIIVAAVQGGGSSELDFTPTLANGTYTHVQYTLNQATASGGAFDPTTGFWFRVQYGNTGFGFDNPNSVQIDNVTISLVPEPGTACLLALGAACLIWKRRRS